MQELTEALDAFSDDADADRLRHLDHGGDERMVIWIAMHPGSRTIGRS
jgi:hypothetical protein